MALGQLRLTQGSRQQMDDWTQTVRSGLCACLYTSEESEMIDVDVPLQLPELFIGLDPISVADMVHIVMYIRDLQPCREKRSTQLPPVDFPFPFGSSSSRLPARLHPRPLPCLTILFEILIHVQFQSDSNYLLGPSSSEGRSRLGDNPLNGDFGTGTGTPRCGTPTVVEAET